MRHLLLALFIALIAAPALAANWQTCTGSTLKSTIKSGEELCVDLATGDLASAILYTGQCGDNFDVVYNADYTGTGTTSDVQILSCVTSACNVNACNPIADAGSPITLTGGPGSTDIGGAFGSYICVSGSNDPVSEEPRVLLKCN